MVKMKASLSGQVLLAVLYIRALHAIPAPVNFTIHTHNFIHILQWSTGINSPPETVFNIKQRCGSGKPRQHLNIRGTMIDVSETLNDIFTICTFRIWASLDNRTSSVIVKSFRPYEDTIIGPPGVLLNGCGECLNITISLPNEPRKRSQLLKFYNSVSFIITWKRYGLDKVNQISTSEKQFILQNLQPGVKYCVKVLPQINSNPNTRSSSWECEYTSKEEQGEVLHILSWSLGALPVVGGMVLLGVLMYTGFVCKPKYSLPKSLCNIIEANIMDPEQIFCNFVSTEVNKTSRQNATISLNSEITLTETSQTKGYEDEIDSAQKADSEDEDYSDEDEVNHSYMVYESFNCELKSNNFEMDIGVMPSNNSSTSYSKSPVIKQVMCEKKHKNYYMSDIMEDRNKHLEATKALISSESAEKLSADVSEDINLFSVCFQALEPKSGSHEKEIGMPKISCNSLQKDTRRLKGIHLHDPIQTRCKTNEEKRADGCFMSENVTYFDSRSNCAWMQTANTQSAQDECATDYLAR